MGISPHELDNPERGLSLTTRGPLAEPAVAQEPEADEDVAENALPLRERVATARRMAPQADDGCRDCWQRGRDAALEVIGAAVDAADERARVETARMIRPSGPELHWLSCWLRGRDAAIEAVEAE